MDGAAKEVAAFILGAIMYTWALWWPIAFTDSKAYFNVALHLGGWGPILSATMLTWHSAGAGAAWQLVRAAWSFSTAALPALAAAALAPAALVAAAATLSRAFRAGRPPALAPSGERLKAAAMWPAIFLVCMVMIVFEEAGWRGFLAPRAEALLGPAAGGALVGAAWSLWHLPLFFWRQEYPLVVDGAPGTKLRYFACYTAGLTAVTYLINWLQAWQLAAAPAAAAAAPAIGGYLAALVAHSSLNATAFAFGVRRLNNLFLFIAAAAAAPVWQLAGPAAAAIVAAEAAAAAALVLIAGDGTPAAAAAAAAAAARRADDVKEE